MSVKWVAGGYSNISTSTIQWSPDGYNWYDASSGGFGGGGAYGVAYGGSGWVAVGNGVGALNSIQWSPDGRTWYDASSGGFTGGAGLGGVAYGNGSGWVAVGYTSGTNSIQWSPDGRAWQDASSGGFIGGGGYYNGVAYDGKGHWVASGHGTSAQNSIQWSPDGRTWFNASSGGFSRNNDGLEYKGQGVAYDGSIWVAVGYGETPETTIKWSPDGRTWYDASSGGFDNGVFNSYGNGVACDGKGRWVAVGRGPTPEKSIQWSPNGTDWSDASNGFFGSLGIGVAYDGNRWIAVGSGSSTESTILWSPDGRTWHDASSGGFVFPTGFGNSYCGYSIAARSSTPLPCFVTGTRILTPTGYKKVEEIESGDLIRTSDNRNVKASMYRFTIESTTEETAPYTIQAGALGKIPLRDLHISGHHAIQVHSGVWQIPKFMTNKQVKQHPVGETVTYYHIECENYLKDNLVAEGVIAESYNHSKQPTVWKKGAIGYVRRQETRKDWWRASTYSHGPARTPSSAQVTRRPDPRGPPSRPAAN